MGKHPETVPESGEKEDTSPVSSYGRESWYIDHVKGNDTSKSAQRSAGPRWSDRPSAERVAAARVIGLNNGTGPCTYPSALARLPHVHSEDTPLVHSPYRATKVHGGEESGWVDPKACLPSINCRDRSAPDTTPKNEARVEITAGAGVVKVQREHERHAVFPPTREAGDIVGLSESAARRLQVRMARVKEDHQPVFATLTYPDVYGWSGDMLKDQIERLWKRIERRCSGLSMVWKIEIERRKSGALGPQEAVDPETGEVHEVGGVQMPHVHLLVFKDTPGHWSHAEYKRLQRIIDEQWHAIVTKDADTEALQRIQDGVRGEGDHDVVEDHRSAGTRTERIRSRRGTLYYIAEYIAQDEDALDHSIGRYWGIYGRESLPIGEIISLAVQDATACRMLRAIMRSEEQEYTGLPLSRTHLTSDIGAWETWILQAIDEIPEDRVQEWVDYISTGQKTSAGVEMSRSSFGDWEAYTATKLAHREMTARKFMDGELATNAPLAPAPRLGAIQAKTLCT